MTLDELDNRIQGLEKQIVDMRRPMAAAHAVFVEKAAQWAAEFWPAHAKEVVVKNPELAKQHGADGTLRKLRTDIAALVGNAHDHAARALGSEVLSWPHNAEDLSQSDAFSHAGGGMAWSKLRPGGGASGPSAPEVLEDPSVALLHLVAPILDDHGYPTTTRRNASYSGSIWGGHEYRYHCWSEEMAEALSRYAELHVALIEKRSELQMLLRDRAATEAESAWDEAA